MKGLPYSWFVNLEVPLGKTRFASPERMNSYGFLVDSAPTRPIPISCRWDSPAITTPVRERRVLDITCAACHTGELVVNKNGKRYGLRIDGGAAMHAFTTPKPGNFTLELLASLTSTYLDPFKFNRFAMKVLGPDLSPWILEVAWRPALANLGVPEAGVESTTTRFIRSIPPSKVLDEPMRWPASATPYSATNLARSNYRIGDAPVRYPPVWDIWKFDYVQYNASVRQPMSRNLGESLGVGAKATLLNRYGGPIPEEDRFDTTSEMDNLHKIEVALWSLEPPKWSEDCFGKIDWEKAAEGQKLFAMTCAQCHGPFPASDPIKEWKAPLKTAANAKYMETAWDDFLASAYKQSPNQGHEALRGSEVELP